MSTPDPSHSGADSGDQAAADLAAALDELSLITVADQSLDESLSWVAHLAVVAVPGADGAGVTMHESGHPQTVAASEPFVGEVDAVQYSLGEGPCITAAATIRTELSRDLARDPRWPRFGPRARDLGVNSATSVPLVLADGQVMGAINVYARALYAFDDGAAARAEAFAVAAAVTVNNARSLMQAHRLTEQLTTALHSRAVIDQAIGILLSRQGGSSTEAFATLRRLSQNQNVKLAVVAENLVREAVTRAHARRGDHG